MFLTEIDGLSISSLYESAGGFFDAVEGAFSIITNTLSSFFELISSFFDRLYDSQTSLSSFIIMIFAIFICFVGIKIWRH